MSSFGGGEIVKNGLVLALDAANVKSYPGTSTASTPNLYPFISGTNLSRRMYLLLNSNANYPIDSSLLRILKKS